MAAERDERGRRLAVTTIIGIQPTNVSESMYLGGTLLSVCGVWSVEQQSVEGMRALTE